MRKIFFLIAVGLSFSLTGTLTTIAKSGEENAPSYLFADVETGQKILTADDNYMNRMSPAEIAIRTGSTTADKTADDLKAQYRTGVLGWTEAEKKQITDLIAANKDRLAKINHLLPKEILFVKVNNKVEGGLPHTRANAIILPTHTGPLTETLFYHELFHVLSRAQKSKHHDLYGMIGFKPCDLRANKQIAAMTLTNPDIPAEGYYLPVEIDGKPSAIMTFLHASRPAFDPAIKRGFGGHFGFGLLKVTVEKGKCSVDVDANGKARILKPATVPDFYKNIGKNTHYIIHAEEVLADNFVYAMTGKTGLPNQEITDRLYKWLTVK